MINIFILFFIGVYCLCLVRKHILLCLISLEIIIIYLIIILYFICVIYNYCIYIYIIYITFFVCEGALGLRLVVYLIRCHSNDYINSIILW